MKYRKWRWVTRNNFPGSCITIWGSVKKPIKTESDRWSLMIGGGFVMCYEEFRKVTGIVVPTDRPIKIEFYAKELRG